MREKRKEGIKGALKAGSGDNVSMDGKNVVNGAENEPTEAKSDEYVIRKGIPLPKQRTRKGLVDKFPLSQMDVKDSFLTNIPHTKGSQNKLGGMIRKYIKLKRLKMQFTARKDEKSGYLAVWRIK